MGEALAAATATVACVVTVWLGVWLAVDGASWVLVLAYLLVGVVHCWLAVNIWVGRDE